MWILERLLLLAYILHLSNAHIHAIRAQQAFSPASYTTLAPPTILQQDAGCLIVSAALNTCVSSSPEFANLSPSEQASCLCYSSSTWLPETFDDAVETCAAFASTALPSAYPVFQSLQGFCASVGNVGPRAVTSAPSSRDCTLVQAFFSICQALTRDFNSLAAQDQAPCFCYASGTVWAPGVFDNAAASCASYAVSDNPPLFSIIGGFTTFCASVGDVYTTSDLGLLQTLTVTTLPAVTSNAWSNQGLAPSTTPTSSAQSLAASSSQIFAGSDSVGGNANTLTLTLTLSNSASLIESSSLSSSSSSSASSSSLPTTSTSSTPTTSSSSSPSTASNSSSQSSPPSSSSPPISPTITKQQLPSTSTTQTSATPSTTAQASSGLEGVQVSSISTVVGISFLMAAVLTFL